MKINRLFTYLILTLLLSARSLLAIPPSSKDHSFISKEQFLKNYSFKHILVSHLSAKSFSLNKTVEVNSFQPLVDSLEVFEKKKNLFLEKELERQVSETVKILNKQIKKNNKLLKEGRIAEVDFIVDMRRIYAGEANEFISRTTENQLNSGLGTFQQQTGKCIYVVLSPIMPEYLYPTRNGQPVLTNYKRTDGSDFFTYKQMENFREKYSHTIAVKSQLSTKNNTGVLLNVQSVMYYEYSSKKWKLKYPDKINCSSKIDSDVQQSIKADITTGKVSGNITFNMVKTDNEKNLGAYIEIIKAAVKKNLVDLIVNSNQTYTKEMLPKLSAAQRVAILGKISNGIMTDDWLGIGNNKESLAVNIVNTTPANQIDSLFTGIQNNSILLNLVGGLNDKIIIGDDNYSAFIIGLMKLHKTNGGQSVKSDKIIFWGIRNEGSDYQEGVLGFPQQKMSSTGSINLNYTYYYKCTGKYLDQYPEQESSGFGAFETINLVFQTDPDQTLFPGAVANKAYPVPGIFYYYYRDKRGTDFAIKSAWDAVQLASVAIGIGELGVLNSWYKAWAISEIIINSADFILNQSTARTWISNQSWGPEFLFYWDRGVKIANLVYLSPFAIKFAKGFIGAVKKYGSNGRQGLGNKWDDVENLSQKMENELDQVSNVTTPKIDLLFSDPTLKSIKDDIIAGKITRQFENLISVEEQSIIRYYTTSEGYNNFNKALRGEIPMTDFYVEQQKLLNQALGKLPSNKYPIAGDYIFRGIGKSEFETLYANATKNDIVTYDNFFSSSIRESVADNFTIKQEGNCVLVLERSKIKNGHYISDISDASNEAEVLFISGVKFKITNITYRPRISQSDPIIKEIYIEEL